MQLLGSKHRWDECCSLPGWTGQAKAPEVSPVTDPVGDMTRGVFHAWWWGIFHLEWTVRIVCPTSGDTPPTSRAPHPVVLFSPDNNCTRLAN